jgi:hypothetical protein
MHVVMFEDRESCLTGLKLAILSLFGRCQNRPSIEIWVPDVPVEFIEWIAKHSPSVVLHTTLEDIKSRGWNVKPAVLLKALGAGHGQVLWVDSDILLTGDLLARLNVIPVDVLVATEDYFWGHHQGAAASRARELGRHGVRSFPAPINSGLVRVSQGHQPLLRAWNDVLASEQYITAQTRPPHERPACFWGDQDVLTGLLEADAFADVAVHQLRRGIEIAQCHGAAGFTPWERIRWRRDLPLVVHAMGEKPWSDDVPELAIFESVRRRLHRELGVYSHAARYYARALDEDCFWMWPTTMVGRAMQQLLPHSPAWREMPLAVIESLAQRVRQLVGKSPRNGFAPALVARFNQFARTLIL